MATYSGSEEAVDLALAVPVDADALFDLRPPNLPKRAVPVFDDQFAAVIGYRYEGTTGVYKFYDLGGELVGMEEIPIENSLLDPLDLIFLISGVFRAIGKGVVNGIVRTAPKVAASAAVRISARGLAVAVFGAMRTVFKGLAVRNLKFTATTAARMATAGRHVPVHILHLAIKYGKKSADPEGVVGAFKYVTKLLRNGKEYTLEVVVRESDWTILHFLYK